MSRPFLAVAAASAAVVAWASLSHPAAQADTVYLAAGLALLVLSAGTAQDVRFRESLKAGLLAAALISASLGLVQYFGASARLAPWVDLAPAGEAYANLRQTNQFATLCCIGMAVLLAVLPRLKTSTAVACAVLLATACAASVSRTGLLQGVVLVLLVVLWPAPDRRRRLLVCAIAAGTYVAMTPLLPLIFEAATGSAPARTLWARISNGQGCGSRAVLWSNVLTLIGKHPWMGWGWGALDEAHFMTRYAGPRFCEILDNAHDLPLHLAVELGVPVAAIITVGGLAWAWRHQPWRERDPQRQLAWAILAIIAVHSLLEYPLWYGPFQIAFGAALGALFLPADDSAQPGARTCGGQMVAGLLLGLTAFAAADYSRVSQIYLPPQQRWTFWIDDPLQEAKRSWLFAGHARFAELTLTTIDRGNAARMALLAADVLRYSPEPRVVERLIEADALLGRDDEAVAMLDRYRAAFPDDYASWRKSIGRSPGLRLAGPQD